MRLLTDGQAVAEVVHAVPHDDHPGDAGDARVLHLLLRVAVPAVGVAVAAVGVAVLLGLVSVLPGGRERLQLGGRQRGLGGGRLGGVELAELRVVVAVVTGGRCAAVGPWGERGRSPALPHRPHAQGGRGVEGHVTQGQSTS